jgi:hypothetical protein
MDTADESRMADHFEHLKAELARNEETISSLRARNIDITIRLIAYTWGISVGDIVRTPGRDVQYIVKAIANERWRYHNNAKPWIVVNPHTKDGIGWDRTRDMNLYANWEKVS